MFTCALIKAALHIGFGYKETTGEMYNSDNLLKAWLLVNTMW